MADKILIVFLSTAIGLCLGHVFYKKYAGRKVYFENLISFSEKMLQNLTFKQENLKEFVLESKKYYSGIFRLSLESFEKYLSGGADFSVGLEADKETVSRIKNFFLSLGTKDLYTQKDFLISEKVYFIEKAEQAKIELTKKGVPLLKIGALLGALAGILLL